MSDFEKPVPAAGEEIHLPGGSMQPLLLTVGVTVALVGVTTSVVLLVAGSLLTVWQLANWIRDTRNEINELPAHHAEH